nr:MAG TPA: hypothetical protein [Bacteriophage sp.]
MNQTDIHFRTGGNITHAGVEVLPSGKDIEYIVLESIEFKERERINGRNQDGVWIGHFAPNPYTSLPWVINSTNRRRLAKLFPECEGYLARLRNVAIRLTKEKTRDPQDGGECLGLRVSLIPAKKTDAPAKKVIQESQISAVVDWARKNGLNIDNIAEKYDFASNDVRQTIIDNLEDLPE